MSLSIIVGGYHAPPPKVCIVVNHCLIVFIENCVLVRIKYSELEITSQLTYFSKSSMETSPQHIVFWTLASTHILEQNSGSAPGFVNIY